LNSSRQRGGGSALDDQDRKVLAAPVVKVTANFMKACVYFFMTWRPRKRFSAPHRAKPLIDKASTHQIPKIILQTNYTTAAGSRAALLRPARNPSVESTGAAHFIQLRAECEFG
jgi:hypothetical protein